MGKVLERFATREIPNFRLVIGAARSHHLAVRADGNTEHEILMSLRPGERLQFLAGRRVPHLKRLVEAGRDHLLAVGRVRHRIDRLGMAFEKVSHDRRHLRLIGKQPTNARKKKYARCGSQRKRCHSMRLHGKHLLGMGHQAGWARRAGEL